MGNMIGIYKIENIVNNKIYIGSCSNFNVRKGSHLCLLRQGEHHSIKLQRSFDKYGEINFIITLIEKCEKENLISREQYYIDTLKPFYNICLVAGSTKGRIFTDLHKERLSKSLTGKIRTEEQKERQRQIKMGKAHTEKTKEKVSKIANIIKGNRVCDKINSEQILKFINIANKESNIKTVKQICKENNLNYRSILRFVSNQTWKEHYNLLNSITVLNFKNPSLTKKK